MIYEIEINLSGKTIFPDWYLPEYDIYIEYWGLEGKPAYDQRKTQKLELYVENGKQVLNLKPRHMSYKKNNILLEKQITQFINKKKEFRS